MVERFEAGGVPKDQISFERDTYAFNYPGAPSELVAVFRDYDGPTMNAFTRRRATARRRSSQTSSRLSSEQNTSNNGTSIPATFLRVTVKR